MSDADNTRYWLRLIHEHQLRMSGAVENASNKIQDHDWSEDALPLVFLQADIAKLRQLANMLDAKLAALIIKTKDLQHESA
jgi:hypothetical protein